MGTDGTLQDVASKPGATSLVDLMCCLVRQADEVGAALCPPLAARREQERAEGGSGGRMLLERRRLLLKPCEKLTPDSPGVQSRCHALYFLAF